MDGLLCFGSAVRYDGSTLKLSMRETQRKTGGTVGAASYDVVFQSMNVQTSMEAKQDNSVHGTGLKELCKAAFERNFGHCAGTSYYHVMDATAIARENWCHEDFPYDKFFAPEVDASVLDWKPARANPSQLASDIQSKITSTLGKCAIVLPPALNEKMKQDPALCEKVARNIDRMYAFHVGGGPRLALPGTKFYGTRIYSAVTILNEDGEVENCRVSSGGGIIGPDEETLRQIERAQKRKAKRKAENRRLDEDAALKRLEMRRALWQNDSAASTAARTPVGDFSANWFSFL